MAHGVSTARSAALTAARRAFVWLALVGVCLGYPTAAQDPAEPTPRRDADALLRQAWTLVRATEFEAAFELFDQALEIGKASGNRRQEAEAMLAMGLALFDSGAWRQGARWIEDALPLVEELRSISPSAEQPELAAEEARVRYRLARAYNVLAQRSRAREELERAAVIYRQLGDVQRLAEVIAQRSLVEVHDRKYAAAVHTSHRALEFLPRHGQDAQQIAISLKALSAQAYGHHQLKQLHQALASYERILELAWQVNNQRQMNFAYCNRAEIRWQLGDKRPAEEDLRRAIQGWEQARDRIPGTADQRAEFLAVQVAAYDRLVRYLAETSRGSEAFEITERFHARSFLEMLDHPALLALGARLPKVWERRRELLDELGMLRLRLDREDGDGRQLRRQLDRLEGELQAVETRLIWHQRELEAAPAPPTLEAVQAGLEAGEALVSYWLSEERVFAWVVVESAIHLVHIPTTQAELEEQVSRYLEPLRAPRRAEDAALRGSESRHLELGQTLYRQLIGALPAAALRARRLIVVPDGVLHYLPFESLVIDCPDMKAGVSQVDDKETIHAVYATCRYLGLEHSLIYSTSAGAFLGLRERHRQRHLQRHSQRPSAAADRPELLAFAPEFARTDPPTVPAELRGALYGRAPLAHAREEVRRIAGYFSRASVRFDLQASESRLKDEVGRYRLLHLATHGLVSDDFPMSSGVLLAAGDGDDGLLQAHEVLGLELSADIVTLSACRTGRGRLRRGEGVVGLSRAFLAAGASSVVVSLWDVDDRATPLFMEAFYEQIAAGVAAPEAMLKARRTLFRQTTEARLVFRQRPMAYAHPRFWASFVVAGNP